jgi:hypothetical protein
MYLVAMLITMPMYNRRMFEELCLLQCQCITEECLNRYLKAMLITMPMYNRRVFEQVILWLCLLRHLVQRGPALRESLLQHVSSQHHRHPSSSQHHIPQQSVSTLVTSCTSVTGTCKYLCNILYCEGNMKHRQLLSAHITCLEL